MDTNTTNSQLFPLTKSQELILSMDQYAGNSVSSITVQVILKNETDPEKIKAVVNRIIAEDSTLRTVIIKENDEYCQYFSDYVYEEVQVYSFDTTGDREDYIQQQAKRWIQPVNNKLYRIFIAYCSENNEYSIVMTVNHIIGDAWSMYLLKDQFVRYLSDNDDNIGDGKLYGYDVYIEEEQAYLSSKRYTSDKEYWLAKFADYEKEELILRNDHTFEAGNVRFSFTDDECRLIDTLTERYQISPNVLLQSLYALVLKRTSCVDELCIGMAVYNRSGKMDKKIAGMMTNTIPIRYSFEKDISFRDYIKKVNSGLFSDYKHQRFNYGEILSAFRDERSSSDTLYDILFNWQICPGEDSRADVQLYTNGNVTEILEITAMYDKIRREVSYNYKKSCCCEDEVMSFHARMIHLMAQIVSLEDMSIDEYEIITDEEKNIILDSFNVSANYDEDSRTAVEMFEEQVKKHIDRTAVVFGDKKLTYNELNENANVIAHNLRDKGVKTNELVAVISDRSAEMVTAIIGVVKSGAAYVPIDPTYPEERIRFILEDSNPTAVVKFTNESVEIPENVPVIDLSEADIWNGNTENPEKVNAPTDLLYCIYTSGTTGKPKGVLQTHRTIVNLVDYEYETIGAEAFERTLFATNYGFDVSVQEYFSVLLCGGTGIIITIEEKQDIPVCLRKIAENRVKTLFATPSYFEFLSAEGTEILAASVENVILAGEAFKVSPKFLETETVGHIKMHNHYGPTESHVVTAKQLTIGDMHNGLDINLGKPISSTGIYIMDGNTLCGIGVPGELCITGAGLARGYLNRPELTAEKFVDSPFGEGKMYRTGDLAMWLSDGNIEYLGRIDEQVKIRGFRIEPGEIESRIREFDGVKDCAVIARADSTGDKALYAYFTSDEEINPSNIRDKLMTEIPEYMVPAYIMQIEAIPVTQNGKLDKRALPEIEARITREYIAPETETEKKICAAFCEILNIKRVGTKDSFFELGGHSLKATRLVNTIETMTGTRIALKDVFSHPTPGELAEIAENSASEYTPIPKAEEKEFYPMSSSQKRTYLIQQMEPESVAYNMPACISVSGHIDRKRLEKALQKMLNSHEILRTSFVVENGELMQKIEDKIQAVIGYEENETSTEQELSEKFVRAFELDKPPFVRVKLIRRSSGDIVLFDMHHIISDGMSENIFICEFNELYNGTEFGKLPCQYKDYSEWMRTRDIRSQEKYWKSEFDDEIPVLDLPTDYPRPQNQSTEGATLRYSINRNICNGIKELSAKTGATEYMIFLAAFMVTLSKYSRQEDIVVGSPISGRTHKDTESMLGMFVNTLAMRGRPEKNKSFKEFLNEVRNTCLKAYENQEYPFDELIEKLDVRRDASRNPLFDVLLVMQNNDQTELNIDGMTAKITEIEYKKAKFDLSIEISTGEDSYNLVLEYCTELFKASTAERICRHLETVIKEVTENPELKIAEIAMITDDEKAKIFNTFNVSEEYVQDGRTATGMFEEQVKKYSYRTAVVFGEKKLTYNELNENANVIAHNLRDKGVKTNELVAVISDRSAEMVTAIIGVIKSGAAYVPIDPTYPEERIRFILEDSNPAAVVKFTNESVEIPENVPVIDLSEADAWNGNTENPERVNVPTDLLYCIYTSGTTGKPKGVLLENRGLIGLVISYKEVFGITEFDRLMQFASSSFDQSVGDIFGALLNGAALYVVDGETRYNVKALENYINRNKITVVSLTPKVVKELSPDNLPNLRLLDSGGEAGDLTVLKKWAASGIIAINSYGPTEATVNTSCMRVNSRTEKLTIGNPLRHLRMFIVADGTLCGIGVPGELCITGAGLARGYLNRPELTAEKFVDSPFGEGKMYRTGDLAMWLSDGNIEYLGRIDEQVKIRGFRIEPGEIESRIREFGGVKDCAVIARADSTGDKALYAYFTSDEEITPSDIRNKLMTEIPEYMVPAYIMQIEAIPITKNGKLDKRALPEIEARITREYVAPETETERNICAAFCEILNIEQIGTKDSFFELGGHSLKATRLVNTIETMTGTRLALKDVFSHPTPGELAEIAENSASKYTPIPKAEEKEFYPMSSSQKRIYLIQQMEPESVAYNMPAFIRVSGKPDFQKFEDALRKLIDRHEILRTQFIIIDGELVQRICNNAGLDFEYISCSRSDSERIMDDFVKTFNLSKPPLVRVKIADSGNDYILMIDMHHIISDGMSSKIFITELLALYNDQPLMPLSRQYKDYSEWMRTRDISNQEEYWVSQFNDDIPVLNMPTDYPRPNKHDRSGSEVKLVLDKDRAGKLKNFTSNTEITEYMFFIAVAMITLSKYSRQDDIVIGSPISGRTHRDTESMLGMFVNTLAMRGRPEKNKTVRQFISEIRELCLEGYDNQEYPFEELVEKVNVPRNIARNPLFDVLLVLQNNEKAEIKSDEFDISYIMQERTDAKFDMNFSISENNGEYELSLVYCTALYKNITAERILAHFANIIDSIIADDSQLIGDISAAGEDEESIIRNIFNNTYAELAENAVISRFLLERFHSTPNDTALVYEGRSVSYGKLDIMTRSLAGKLRGYGVGKDDFVVVIADRGIEMIAGILAVILAGGAYVPAETSYPDERLRYIISDCSPKAVLKYGDINSELTGDIPVIDLADSESWSGQPVAAESVNSPDDLIYCIYTSGTTGRPKGVMITHKGVVNLCENFMCRNYTDDIDNISLVASFAFDSSVKMIFSSLLMGRTLFITSDAERKDPKKLQCYFSDNSIKMTDCTPTHLKMFLTRKPLCTLKYIYSGGENLTSEIAVELIRNNFCERICNVYGPTECTVDATSLMIDKDTEKVTIGKPVANSSIYILDDMTLCGIGMPGELCIAGIGVARGYLNRPELTEEKFVASPFGDGRMYRTGDLARWLPDGNIEYLGRIDEQVKIRGYRIEPGETESRIREISSINDCAVIAKPDRTGDMALYAYYMSDAEISPSEIKDSLRAEMPEYMVPAYIMQIDTIPVTKNGKLDKRALPEIEARTESEYIAPETETEKLICRMFSEILGTKRVGANDSFFELGGHSLKATRLVNWIKAETGADISIMDIFKAPAPRQLAVLAEQRGESFEPIPSAEEKEYYSMSSAQKRTFLIQQIDPSSTVYNMPVRLKLTGDIDVQAIKNALQKLIDRHEILRTAFVMEDGKLFQKILSHAEANFEYATEAGAKEETVCAFDLSKPPLLRAKLIDCGDSKLLVFDMHHIISDGMSMSIFVREFITLYNGGALKPLTHQFKDYSEWMNSRDLSSQAEYWKSEFANDVPVLDMHTDYPRTQEQSYDGAETSIVIDEEASNSIRVLARSGGMTEFMVFLASVMIVLSKYSRQEDIIIGMPISGRTHRDTEGMLGMFVNTLAMRGKPEKNKKVQGFLEEIKETCLKAYENQEYPFEELVDAVRVKRDLSRNPLFDVMLDMHNNDRTELKLGSADAQYIEEENISAKFDLSFDIMEQDGKYLVSLEYCTALFKPETANGILMHLAEVLKAVAADTSQKLSDINCITSDEEKLILDTFNKTYTEDTDSKLITELFEEQVRNTPDRTAVIFEGRHITYAQLYKSASIIANKLHEAGAVPDDFVAVISDRSLEMIEAVYGILLSGAAYVPIDPTYPQERISYILNDCSAKAAIIFTKQEIAVPDGIIGIDLSDSSVWNGDTSRPTIINKPENTVYCIYTSGTTGKSKGVLIKHRNLVSYVSQFIDYFGIDQNTSMLQQAYIGFDTSVEELYPALISGGKIVGVTKETLLDAAGLKKIIIENGVNIISCSPLLVNEMDFLTETEVKTVISGGDVLKAEYIKGMAEAGIAVYNTYGPTEATVCVSYYKVCSENIPDNIPVGKPIVGSRLYIADGNNLCGIGVPGEICIAGKGVAGGYLNRDELTNEKFVSDPFGEGRMYRTGDLARWLPDGNIEYLGRIDEQVKIRGFRIELGEIESRIHETGLVKDCAVIVRNDSRGEKSIYAYYTSGEEVAVSDIRAALRKTLPGYMIPAYMMQIDALPVTQNGKLDKRSLPEIEVAAASDYVAPSNDIEKQISEIYCEVIGCEVIGIYDNFFDVGGDSLKLMRAVTKIDAVYPSAVKLVDFFSHPTIASMAECISSRLNYNKEKLIIIPFRFTPEMFDTADNNDDDEVEIDLSREESLAIADSISEEHYSLSEVMIAAFVFVLSRMYNTERVSVQCITDTMSDKAVQVSADLSEAESFSDIADNVKETLENSADVYTQSDYTRYISKDGSESVPLFVCGNASYEYLKNYDVVVGYTFEGNISLKTRFNSDIISRKEICRFMEQYAEMMSYLM